MDHDNIIASQPMPDGFRDELEEQAGSPESLASLGAAVFGQSAPAIRDTAGLRDFLRGYCGSILIPVELEVILEAHSHAVLGHARELIELDQRVSQQSPGEVLARASQRIGRGQLRRLKPLRGEKMVRRYLDAVLRGQARGWHTVVYGMFLALHAIPLRQGLVHYGCQTINGFIDAAAVPLQLSAALAEEIQQECHAILPAAVQQTLVKSGAAAALKVI